MRALEARHHELAPLYAVKRQFVQRKAMNKHQGRRRGDVRRRRRCARELEARDRRDAVRRELAFARARDALAAGRGGERRRARPRAALRGVGRAHAGRAAQRTSGGVLFRAPRKLDSDAPRAGRAVTHAAASTALDARRRPRCARREGFALTDRGHRPRRRARPGALLHLVPRAGQGLVLARAAREEARRRRAAGESVQEDARSA